MTPSTTYRERLRPPLWLYGILALIIPAVLITSIPIHLGWGVFAALALYTAVVAAVALLPSVSPILEVKDGWFRAGSARIEVGHLGTPNLLEAERATEAMRTGWDAAAHHVTVPWVKSLVTVPVTDPDDPTTAWVVSTRNPSALAKALSESGATIRETAD